MISVIVPTRDRTTRLLLTLAALAQQNLRRADYEVILVDDSPRPGAVEQVLAALPDPPPIRVTHSGGRGVAAARNTGARLARGALLLFLDDDTLAGPDLLAAHQYAHEHNTVAHGRIIDLTAFRFSPDPPHPAEVLPGAGGRALGLRDLPALDQLARRLGPRRSFIEGVARTVAGHPALRWLACVGTSTSMSRELLTRAGGFDEDFGELWGGEDLELGLRLAEIGADFRLLPARAYHLPLARHSTGEDLSRFWALAAARHGRPPLARVAEFLSGRIGPGELASALTREAVR
ncbi:glycosyltransferase family 2 protein [Crossiella sp. CA198]|uniref:glycosyltransferase family 2 protein n=1 Tax=Crossiella sp. CA198 TaxID=3455607 RepID=UPI003F8D1CD3